MSYPILKGKLESHSWIPLIWKIGRHLCQIKHLNVKTSFCSSFIIYTLDIDKEKLWYLRNYWFGVFSVIFSAYLIGFGISALKFFSSISCHIFSQLSGLTCDSFLVNCGKKTILLLIIAAPGVAEETRREMEKHIFTWATGDMLDPCKSNGAFRHLRV